MVEQDDQPRTPVKTHTDGLEAEGRQTHLLHSTSENSPEASNQHHSQKIAQSLAAISST